MTKVSKYLLLSLPFVVGFGVLGRVSFGEARIYMYDIFALLFAFFWVGRSVFEADTGIKYPFVYISYLFFLLWLLVSLLLGINNVYFNEWVVGGGYLLRIYVYSVLLFGVFELVKNNVVKVGSLIQSLKYSGVLMLFLGFIQLVVFPDFRELDPALGWDPHINRMASTFLDPNYLAVYLNLVFATTLITYYKTKNKLDIVIMVGLLTGVLLTFSRSGWLMLALMILVFGIFKERKILVVGLILVVLSYALIPRVQTRIAGTTDPADSAAFRLVSWSNSLEIARDNLITGVGYNLYRYAQADYGFFDYREPLGGHAGAGADSSFLTVLATSGVVGAVLYGFFWFGMVFKFLERYLQKRNVKDLILFSALGALMVQTNIINTLFFIPILLYLFILIPCVQLYES